MTDWNAAIKQEKQTSENQEINIPKQENKTDWNKLILDQKTKEPQRLEWYQVLGQAVMNLPESGYEFLKNIIQPIIHPVKTGKAITRIGLGGVEKIAPKGFSQMLAGPQYDRQYEQEFDQVIDFFIDRYGTVENFKNTTAKDPIGVMADVASIFSGLGAGIRGTGGILGKVSKLQKIGGTIEKIGEKTQKLGATVEPISIAKEGLRLLPTEKMYESAAKFSTVARKPGETSKIVRKRMVQTALTNKIMPTYKGLEKLRDKINQLDEKIDELVKIPTQQGITISAGKLLEGFPELEKMTYQFSGEPIKNIRAIKNIKEQFRKVNGIFDDKGKLIGYKQLTPEELQKKKVTIYKELENYYNKVMMQPAKIKAQKTIARAAKESLVDIIPEINELNKAYGPLKELENALDRVASRITNRDLMGIGIPIKTGAGYAATGQVGGAMAGLIWGLMDTPQIKAKLSILINGMKKQGISMSSPTEAAIELGLFQAGRESEIIKNRQ